MPEITKILGGFFKEEGFPEGPMGAMMGFMALQGAVAQEQADGGSDLRDVQMPNTGSY